MSKKDDFISVSTFNCIIKELLKENLSETVKIKGEVSNLKESNNNTFFTLKDSTSAISVTAWGTTFDISNGDDIFVTGKLTCYTKQGTYNIQAYKAERIGVGNMFETYEKLKQKFEKLGYFSKKRPFPSTINKIGIVSAYGGDALQDILSVLTKNSFGGDVYIKNCYAQGKYCPNSVKDGIEYFNELDEKVDLIVISRGGGSAEDLIGYSAEVVVKAIWESDIFTISAVGHEMNWMFSDHAADHRSATPTRAAEDITCVGREALKEFEMCKDIVANLKSMITNLICNFQKRLESNKTLLNALSPSKCIENELNVLKGIKHMFYNKIKHKIDTLSHQLESARLKNQSFDTINTFNKGFIMVENSDGKLIKNANEFKTLYKSKQKLKFIFADGEVIV